MTKEADVQRQEVSFTVPLTPPSVNHYKKPRGNGYGYYLTKEAQAYKDAVAVCSRSARIVAKGYAVTALIALGSGQRGDVDNFAKVILDALVYARVIHSDAAISRLTLEKTRDKENPRTEITVRALEVTKARR